MTGHVTERYSHVETAEKARAVLRALPAFEPTSTAENGDRGVDRASGKENAGQLI